MMKRFMTGLTLVGLMLAGAAVPAQARGVAQHDWAKTAVSGDDLWDPARGTVKITPGHAPSPTKADKLITAPKRKLVKAGPPKDGVSNKLVATYFYAGGKQTTSGLSPAVTNTLGNFSGWGATVPYLQTASAPVSYHTLVESAVRKTYNTNNGLIEAGITVDEALYGDKNPRFFVAVWDLSGNFVGYNTSFTLWAGRANSPGDIITANKSILIEYVAAQDNWWIGLGGTYVGYFSVPGVFGSANSFQAVGEHLTFGEVVSDDGTPCDDMGTGALANPSGASVGSVAYNGSGTNVNLSTFATGSPYYTVLGLSARTFRYGGYGHNAAGTGAGTAQAC